MFDPATWPVSLQVILVTVLLFGASLAWFTTDWGGYLPIGAGLLIAVYLRIRNSRQRFPRIR